MRVYVSELEAYVDKSLKKWRKGSHIENGEVVQMEWQFEQTHIILDVFWHDGDEGVNVHCITPRGIHKYEFSGLTPDTIDRVMDRVGNFAQVSMYPLHE